MIDIESTVFESIANMLLAEYPNIFVTPYPTRIPPETTCVSIEEVYNEPYKYAFDSGGTEKYVRVEYEVSVYTCGDGKKSKAKEIINKISDYMSSMGFVRGMRIPIEIYDDNTMYRLGCSYKAIVDSNNKLYWG